MRASKTGTLNMFKTFTTADFASLVNSAAETERTADGFLAWLVARCDVDIVAIWPDLEDAAKSLLVEHGAVELRQPTAEMTYNDSLSSAHSENGIHWPGYTVELSADRLTTPVKVSGWVECGWWKDSTGDGWKICNGESVNGLPYCDTDYNDEWLIGHVEGFADVAIPVWRDDAGIFCTFDRSCLSRDYTNVIDDVATSDEWAEPSIDDLTASDLSNTDDSVWIVKDGDSSEVKLLTGGHGHYETQGFGHDGDFSCSVDNWRVQAWSHELADDEIFDSREDIVKHLCEAHGVEKSYDSEDLLIVDVLDDAARKHGQPDGLSVYAFGRCEDSEAGYLYPDGDQLVWSDRNGCYSHPNVYHPTAREAIAALNHGWGAIIDEIVNSLGRRASLDACRQWADQADAILADRGGQVMVDFDTSIAVGNCEYESRRLLDAMTASFGDITSIDARFLLSLRDDAYSRRACRFAAMRTA